jgi:hypothetical protein
MIPVQVDPLLKGDVFRAIVDVFLAQVPLPIFALLIFGPIGVGYYMVQKSMIIPTIMFLIVGGVTVARIPPTFQSGLLALTVIGVAGIGYVLLQRVEV